MQRPRFRIRTLLIVVAVAAVLLVIVPPWWRYWFQSPWRVVSVQNYTSADDRVHADSVELVFDARKPAEQVRMKRAIRWFESNGAKVNVERFEALLKDRLPNENDR